MTETQTHYGLVFRRFKSGHYGRKVGSKTQYAHRLVWETERGPIPDGMEIHHVDFDPGNNAVDNLACLTSGDHSRLHAELRVQRRGREAYRRAYQEHGVADQAKAKRNAAEPVAVTCVGCGVVFHRTWPAKTWGATCSERCWRRDRDRRRVGWVETVCTMCWGLFWTLEKKPAHLCSRRCVGDYRKYSKANSVRVTPPR